MFVTRVVRRGFVSIREYQCKLGRLRAIRSGCLRDFGMTKSNILKTINRPNRDTAQVVAFSWIDTKEVRPPDSKAYALLNDTEHAVSATVIEALQNYDVQPVPWSRREQVREELAA
jgi:hypothetical protein